MSQNSDAFLELLEACYEVKNTTLSVTTEPLQLRQTEHRFYRALERADELRLSIMKQLDSTPTGETSSPSPCPLNEGLEYASNLLDTERLFEIGYRIPMLPRSSTTSPSKGCGLSSTSESSPEE